MSCPVYHHPRQCFLHELATRLPAITTTQDLPHAFLAVARPLAFNLLPFPQSNTLSQPLYAFLAAKVVLAFTMASYSTSLKANKNAVVMTLCVIFGP